MSETTSTAASGPLKYANLSSTCCLKCSQPYRDPRMLSCCHSFCAHCIQSLITEGTGTNSITCPSCHEATIVPGGGINSFSRNLYLVNKQGDIFGKINANPSLSCDSCGEKPSVAYCTECNEIICKKCWDTHQVLSITRNHVIHHFEDVKKMTEDKFIKILPTFSLTCQVHTNHQLECYCQKCTILVCVKCIIINHKDHPVIEIQEQVQTKKQAIEQSLQEIEKGQQQIKKVCTLVEEMKCKIQAQKNDVNKLIHQTFATFQQLLHQHEQILLAQSSEVANAKEICLSRQLERLKCVLETTTYYKSLATTVLQKYNDVELLSIGNTLQTRANQLQQEFSGASLEVCESPTISVDINTDELTAKIPNVGIRFNEVSPNSTTAVVPLNACIEKELKIIVISRDGRGKQLSKGGTLVSGKLVPIEEKRKPIEAKITDCDNGTYLVTLSSEQLGKHKISLTIKGQSIQGSPFNVSVVGFRNYTTLKTPVQTITDISQPLSLAFSNNDDMFVTSRGKNCIYVYDSDRRQKTTIGSYGSGQLQFNDPSGIVINGNVMYVVEYGGQRIHKLSLEGKFLGTLGSVGSDKGQFKSPWGICLGPDGKIYVADHSNDRIQVFNQDETFSYLIDGEASGNSELRYPAGLAFDLSGKLHVTSCTCNTVFVFSSEGQYIRQYGHSYLDNPHGIAIDSAGNSLVANYGGSLAIFDEHGHFIHSVRNVNSTVDVAVGFDASVWISSEWSNSLFMY